MSRSAICVCVLALLVLGSCTSVARAGDKEDIVGRWDQVLHGGNWFRFNADGTYKQVAANKVVAEGKYLLLPGGVIEMDNVEYKYRLSWQLFLGDTFVLTAFGENYYYTRSK